MEPELCKEILNNKEGAYPKRKLQGFVKKLVGDSMGTSTTEGGKWRKLKKLANHAFHGESLKVSSSYLKELYSKYGVIN